ncbi:MAG: hypothetical protein IT306_16550 [Chloroflexi bacterium]|nr:hypothetical protein [Chloroflexota bacterium]
MEESSPRVTYSPEDGQVIVQTGGPTITVDELREELQFERMSPEGDTLLALWLSGGQADVLSKMVRYVIEKVQIRPESREQLEGLLPQIEALVARHQGE